MERKEFIKMSCSFCAALGAGLSLGSFAGCAPIPVYKTSVNNSKITVPLSVLEGSDVHVLRTENYGFDVAVRKTANGNFLALLLRCTHAANEVEYTGDVYVCNVHGSTFNMKGDVTRGPANKPLARLAVEKSGDNLIIVLE
jgi:Rieske Fe-S protein